MKIKNINIEVVHMLTLVLICLKVTGTIDLPWLWVLMPTWGALLVAILLFALAFLWLLVIASLNRKQ